MYKPLKKIIIYNVMFFETIFLLWTYILIRSYFNDMSELMLIPHDFFVYYNKLVYPGYWDDENEEDKEEQNAVNAVIEEAPKPKYEDKYLEQIRKMNSEWILSEADQLELVEISKNLYQEINDKVKKIEEIQRSIDVLTEDMKNDTDEVKCGEISDEDGALIVTETTLTMRNELRSEKIEQLKNECKNIMTEIGYDEKHETNNNIVDKLAESQAKIITINKRVNKLDNCHVMEKTPIGNVIMMYDRSRCAFKYYSDSNMPYRYLEVVARKFVKVFDCRPLYVDMEEELKLFEEKWEREQALKKENEEKAITENLTSKEDKKPNVFAKFKSYNKTAGGKINMAPPPKNSIPNKTMNEQLKDDAKILLKERANVYNYGGKLANFNFLKKVERKVFNKRLGLTFADFKKQQK